MNHNHVVMAGFFHDCAIPILGANIPDYFSTIDNEMEKKNLIEKAEDKNFGINHTTAGYYIAKE